MRYLILHVAFGVMSVTLVAVLLVLGVVSPAAGLPLLGVFAALTLAGVR